MNRRAYLIGSRQFYPVRISPTSYNLPKGGSIGVKVNVPHLFTGLHKPNISREPDLKISGVPISEKKEIDLKPAKSENLVKTSAETKNKNAEKTISKPLPLNESELQTLKSLSKEEFDDTHKEVKKRKYHHNFVVA